MKVAISIPDPVFKAAEILAGKLKKSRSELYADAIAEYVGSRGRKALTSRLDAVYDRESSKLDVEVRNAQLDILSREAW